MTTGSEHVHRALREGEVDLAVGIPGRGSLPLDTLIRDDDDMRYVLARHETAIPYIAWGYHEAGGGLAATITVPGPGDTNASNGLRNATLDRVPIVHVSTDIPPERRGTRTLHEIDPATYDDVVKANLDVTNPNAVPAAAARAVETALSPPYGPVRLGMPYLDAEIGAGPAEVSPERASHDNDAAYDRAAAWLAAAERPVVYTGVGARRAENGPEAVRALVDALDAPVVCSYKGKGVFPETDPRWAGTTGAQLPAGAVEMLERADVVVALGTAFGGPSSRGDALPLGDRLVHVTPDPDLIDVVYEADAGIPAEVDDACRELTARLGADAGGWDGATVGRRIREEYLAFVERDGMFREGAPASTPAVVRALREELPEEAIVVADIAEFRTWALQLFEATRPEGFIATGPWTSMGVGLPGAIGAKLANPDRPVVCLTGDGGLMQCIEELHTAAEEGIDVTTVVFDNSRYAMIDTTPGYENSGYGWESPDFPAIAEGFGCGAAVAETPAEAAASVEDALDSDRPELVDVVVDPDEPSSMDAWAYESEIDLP